MLLEPAEGTSVVVSYGEATVALFYCGTRLNRRMTRDQVAALVLHGLSRIGQDHAGRIHDAHCASGRAWTRGGISDDEYDRCEGRLWPRSEGGESQRSTACLLVHHRLNPLR
ncbi:MULTISPECIES: hypothetical protein [Amycolatopsis]|uniref:hypothetical protein n=1 Tax=Amycolatopsis TaxID=1813 RepID=UPI001178BF07|nr:MULTISPECIES: hypothetical protein [Amycolatopsis]